MNIDGGIAQLLDETHLFYVVMICVLLAGAYKLMQLRSEMRNQHSELAQNLKCHQKEISAISIRLEECRASMDKILDRLLVEEAKTDANRAHDAC